MENTVSELLRKELLEDYSDYLDNNKSKLTKEEKQVELNAVSKFLLHFVTEKDVRETLEEIIE